MSIIETVGEKVFEKGFSKLEQRIIDRMDENRILIPWMDSFEGAVELSDYFAKGFGKELSRHRGIIRYYYATFDPVSKVPDLDSFIISLGLEFLDFGLELPPEIIIGFGSAVMKNWKKEIYKNKVLKKRIEENSRDIKNIDCINNINELKQILLDKDSLRKKYFKGYEHIDGYKKTRIWLPRPNESWIRWEEEYSVDINVNPMIGMDLGFFRLGYDYSVLSENEDEKLRIASISASKTRGNGEFKNYNIGEKSGEIIWAR